MADERAIATTVEPGRLKATATATHTETGDSDGKESVEKVMERRYGPGGMALVNPRDGRLEVDLIMFGN